MNLSDLRRLCEAATPGPWEHDSGDGRLDIFTVDKGEMVTHAEGQNADDDRANAALIVALRNAAPALIALVEAAGALAPYLPDPGASDSERWILWDRGVALAKALRAALSRIEAT